MTTGRPRWVHRAAVLAAAALLASGCTDEPDEAPDDPATPTASVDGGDTTPGDDASAGPCGTTQLVWAHEEVPRDLHLDDPDNNLAITSWVRQSLWEGLYGIAADDELYPELLAEELEVVPGEDGSITYRGRLRDDLTWSDGTPVTAQQVVDTYDIVMAGYDRAAALDDDPTSDPAADAVYRTSDRSGLELIRPGSIRATSPTAFTFTTDEFFAGYRTMFSEVFPTHVVADAAQANAAFADFAVDGTTLPSTGPLLFGSLEPGVTLELRTNERYHGSVSPDVANDGVACVAGVTIEAVGGASDVAAALTGGDADVVFAPPQPALEDARAHEDVKVLARAGRVFEHWGLNLADPHLTDPLVREALALAVDRSEVVTRLYAPLFGDLLPDDGLGNTYWMPGDDAYVDHMAEAGYGAGDVTAAQDRLTDAGYVVGDDGVASHPERGRLTLRVGTPGGDTLRERQEALLRSQLTAIGVEVVIENVDGTDYFGTGPFSAAALACAAGVPDGEPVGPGPDAVVADCDVWDIAQFAWVTGPWPGSSTDVATCGAPDNPYGYCNDGFDQLAATCNATLDEDERADCYNRLDRHVTTLGPDGDGLFMLPLTQRPSFYAINTQRLAAAPPASDANDAGPLAVVVDFVPAG